MADALLSAQDVTVRFGGLVAVDAVELEVRERELVGVIGPNGAGKTTFFHALSGVLRPTAGRLRLGGEDLTGRPAHVFAMHGVARTFQTPRVFRDMTAEQNVRFGLEFAGRARTPSARRVRRRALDPRLPRARGGGRGAGRRADAGAPAAARDRHGARRAPAAAAARRGRGGTDRGRSRRDRAAHPPRARRARASPSSGSSTRCGR